jgi:hypothetical protein
VNNDAFDLATAEQVPTPMGLDSMAPYRKAAAAYLAAHNGSLLPAQAVDSAPTQWSDAWLLHAIKMVQDREGRATLEDILAAGDFLNHAIFTFEELSGGFQRLERTGFLVVHGAECKLTDAFVNLWRGADAEGRSLAKQSEALRKLLGYQDLVS